jgi:hypothetical protein
MVQAVQIKVGANPHSVEAELIDMSFSGAFLRIDSALNTSARVEVLWRQHAAAGLPHSGAVAHVVRQLPSGVGIEWADFAPPAVCARLNRHWLRETIAQLRA